jgi:hypothetical protein
MVKTFRDQPEMWQIMPAMFIKTEHRKILNKAPEIYDLRCGRKLFHNCIILDFKILSN